MKTEFSTAHRIRSGSRSAVAHQDYPDVKRWVAIACAKESRRRHDSLWMNEPSSTAVYDQRLKRMKFLRKHGAGNFKALALADRLDACNPSNLCLSGACPECGRLLQRWFVRQSERCIAEFDRGAVRRLRALSIVPRKPLYALGRLQFLSITDFHRRLKYALKEVGIDAAIGGIDFALNEHKTKRFAPRWVAHCYLIISTRDPDKVRLSLRRQFERSNRIPRPLKITTFTNVPWRRSYALKMQFVRRVCVNTSGIKGGRRPHQNTDHQRLRAPEQLELWLYLDRIGLNARPIYYGLKPVIGREQVLIAKINKCLRIKPSSKTPE